MSDACTLEIDCFAGLQRELPGEQAMAGLALGVRSLRLASVAGLTGLAGLQIGDDFIMYALYFGIGMTLVAPHAGSDRVSLHGCRWGDRVPAMTIYTVGNVGIVRRWQMAGLCCEAGAWHRSQLLAMSAWKWSSVMAGAVWWG